MVTYNSYQSFKIIILMYTVTLVTLLNLYPELFVISVTLKDLHSKSV